MNRTLALLLTVAVLLAHTLAIHQNSAGDFARPYDDAHVTYRVARNLVETHSFAWDHGSAPVESFPSLSWVAVAAIGDRLGFPVTTFCQGIGALSALITVFVLARFSPDRLAGVIAPLLFVVSGGLAAAAGSGAETSTLSLLVAGSFLAFERRARLSFAILCCLLITTRAEGVAVAAMLFLLEVAGSIRHAGTLRPSLFRAFLPAALLLGAIALARQHYFGTWMSPAFAAWVDVDAARFRTGARYLADFVRATGWTLLLVFPLYGLFSGQLRGFGRRALLLSLGYAAMIAGQGGGLGPMFQPLVPMFALLLIAIQESMTRALDSSRRVLPQLTWALFLVALTGSVLASKYPGDLYLLPTDGLHRRWVTSASSERLGYAGWLGRLGLVEELDVTERLRQLGAFMRERLDPKHSVLTPWPGAIGYQSRLRVVDALGRATPPPGARLPRPWNGLPRADVLALFESAPDYIVPAINWNEWNYPPPTLHYIADLWMTGHPELDQEELGARSRDALSPDGLDCYPWDRDRLAAVREALRAYELITVPVPLRNAISVRSPTRPVHLLRLRTLGLAPKLEVDLDGERFRVRVRHAAYDQLVDLRVVLRDAGGRLWSVLPTGDLREGPTGMMRTSILLFRTGDRTIELASGTFPRALDVVELRAVLRNPLARAEHPFALASEQVSEPIQR